MDKILAIADRTLVLFVGIAVGAVIGLAFVGGGSGGSAAASAPTPTVIADPAPEGAEVASECSTRFDRRLMASLSADNPVHIGVFGDSFGDGLWGAIYRGFQNDDDFVVHRWARQSTGFTRYRSLNVLEDIAARIEEQPIDIAVLSFGANDNDGLWAEGTSTEYMSEEWREFVGARVDAVIQLLRDHGAIIYWVGLPRMGNPRTETDMQQMNAFYENRMRRLGVPFIETVSLSTTPDGQYSAYLPDPDDGERTLVRANDGLHMTGVGYGFLTRGLEARIRNYVEMARAEAVRERERRQEDARSNRGDGDNG